MSKEGDKTTGGGLAWGGGCSPTLTPELVLFTDNQEIVNLIALDMKTGEVVASMPVLDDLPEGYQVAVENSAIVYDGGQGKVSTIVCNWFGAGNAGLANPDSDSSIQSYANIYDMNWLTKGSGPGYRPICYRARRQWIDSRGFPGQLRCWTASGGYGIDQTHPKRFLPRIWADE